MFILQFLQVSDLHLSVYYLLIKSLSRLSCAFRTEFSSKSSRGSATDLDDTRGGRFSEHVVSGMRELILLPRLVDLGVHHIDMEEDIDQLPAEIQVGAQP